MKTSFKKRMTIVLYTGNCRQGAVEVILCQVPVLTRLRTPSCWYTTNTVVSDLIIVVSIVMKRTDKRHCLMHPALLSPVEQAVWADAVGVKIMFDRPTASMAVHGNGFISIYQVCL